MDINELRDVYHDTVDNINAGYNSGYLSESQYANFRQAADRDYAAALNTLELENEPIPMANQLYSSEFGATLLALIDQEYANADDAFADIYEVTGIGPDDVMDLIQGDAVPTPELVASLSQVFDLTYSNPDYADDFMSMAEEAYDEAAAAEEEDYIDPAYYNSDLEYADEEDLAAASYGYNRGGSYANFGYGDPRVNELEATIAEFQLANAVKDDLASLESRAAQGVAEGWLPPIAYETLIGDYARENDRVAAFSAACGANNVSPDAQLFGMHYALGLFERCGPMMDFSAYSDEEYIAPEEMAYESELLNQAVLNHEYYQQHR